MSAVISGLIGGLIAVALAALAERRQKRATRDGDGWLRLRPSWYIHAAVVGCAALSVGAGLLYHYIDPARPDIDEQRLAIAALALGFAAGALVVGIPAYGETMRWKGDLLAVRFLWRPEVVRQLSDVTSIERQDTWGVYRLTFKDGSKVGVGIQMHGARELIEHLPATLQH